ncbi:MAG: shikimate dehydrogenase [Alphaproteobacteria bacterium]|nr:shikimate dehydrogenase [Alphaproteobacteria bacterium]MDE2163020.1 shikimate dehydrogenase [Alphaproteobacteria bacterium]MDE2264786.1 shikimate dehydrogenase [Alphaproteobacteria bacterium]MDE2499112.1 shikimate dehydrogenase [Alphaproteobacteria bacterium]
MDFVDTEMRRAGLIGAGILASRSPSMHMNEAKALGLQLNYELFDLDQIAGGLQSLRRILDDVERDGYLGVNITHPCKQIVIDFLDVLAADVAVIGAVNTVVFKGGKRYGHNTDWSGFATSFDRSLHGVAMNNVLQVGAGGAGAATSYALLKMGAGQVVLYDIDKSRAELLAQKYAVHFGRNRITATADLAEAMAAADGIVNTTPVGMTKYPGTPVPVAALRQTQWVADIVYFPLETELLREARALGCKTLDGGGMAVFQAAEALRLFTGRAPDADRMLRAFAA